MTINAQKSQIPAETAEEKVNRLAGNLTRNAEGKYDIPDDLTELERIAVVSERRRRDTQKDFTEKSKQIKALEAEKNALLARSADSIALNLTETQKDELDDLLISDPELWRAKMNTYENDARKARTTAINEELAEVSKKTTLELEMESNQRKLQDFNQAHPDVVITDDTFENDIPPRIRKKWETGKIDFDEFLDETYKYLSSGKVIIDKKAGEQPNMGEYGGRAEKPKTVDKTTGVSYGSVAL